MHVSCFDLGTERQFIFPGFELLRYPDLKGILFGTCRTVPKKLLSAGLAGE